MLDCLNSSFIFESIMGFLIDFDTSNPSIYIRDGGLEFILQRNPLIEADSLLSFLESSSSVTFFQAVSAFVHTYNFRVVLYDSNLNVKCEWEDQYSFSISIIH